MRRIFDSLAVWDGSSFCLVLFSLFLMEQHYYGVKNSYKKAMIYNCCNQSRHGSSVFINRKLKISLLNYILTVDSLIISIVLHVPKTAQHRWVCLIVLTNRNIVVSVDKYSATKEIIFSIKIIRSLLWTYILLHSTTKFLFMYI